MPKTSHLARPLDLRAPGAIDQLLAFHRTVFGNLRMEEAGSGDAGSAGTAGGDAGTGAGATNTGSGTAGTGDAGNSGQQAGDAKAGEWDGKVESLPEPVQKMIRDLRTENGDRRTKLTAAEQSQQDMVKAFAKAAGIEIPGEQPDPNKLTEQLTTAQAAQRQTAVELAVYKTASKHSGDPDALLDSRTFLAKVADLDPAAKDFASKVDEAIKSAVTDNPKLKAARAAGQSSVDHAGGSGEKRTSEKLPSMEQAVAAHYGTATT